MTWVFASIQVTAVPVCLACSGYHGWPEGFHESGVVHTSELGGKLS